MTSEFFAFFMIGLACGLFLSALQQVWIDHRHNRERRQLQATLKRSREALWS